jgi:hypothetical protein
MKACVPKRKSMKEAEKEEKFTKIIVIIELKLLLFLARMLKKGAP